MTDLEIDAAGKLRTKASKSLDAMRAHVALTDATRSDTVHQTRVVQVVEAATTAADANRVAAEAWTALATHATKQALDCRRGAELADRTRHRWAR